VFGKAPRGATQRPATPDVKKPLVPAWLWLIFGTLLGLSFAVVLYLWQPWQPSSRVEPEQISTTEPPADSTATAEQKQSENYQFYDLLPKQQVTPVPDQAVPKREITAAEPLPDAASAVTDVFDGTDLANTSPIASSAGQSSTSAAAEVQPVYLLQVNSFTDADEADRQRAEVLLVGLSADVRQTTTRDGTLWYRVVSGPYVTRNEAMIAQRNLQDSGIDSLVVEQR
jgi:cell division protein FtsN